MSYNQAAPFWDFIASLESAGAEHPFFAAYNPRARAEGRADTAADGNTAATAAAPQADDSTPATAAAEGEHADHDHGHPCGRRGGPHRRGGPYHGFGRGGRCGGGQDGGAHPASTNGLPQAST